MDWMPFLEKLGWATPRRIALTLCLAAISWSFCAFKTESEKPGERFKATLGKQIWNQPSVEREMTKAYLKVANENSGVFMQCYVALMLTAVAVGTAYTIKEPTIEAGIQAAADWTVATGAWAVMAAGEAWRWRRQRESRDLSHRPLGIAAVQLPVEIARPTDLA